MGMDDGGRGGFGGRGKRRWAQCVIKLGLDFGYSRRLMDGIEQDGTKSFVYFLPHGWYLIVSVQSRSPFQSGIYEL